MYAHISPLTASTHRTYRFLAVRFGPPLCQRDERAEGLGDEVHPREGQQHLDEEEQGQELEESVAHRCDRHPEPCDVEGDHHVDEPHGKRVPFDGAVVRRPLAVAEVPRRRLRID